MLSFAPTITLPPPRPSRPPLHPRRPASASLHPTPPASPAPPPLILGLNQYTHDASLAVLHARTGAVLLALSKERLTRHKHAAGDLSLLISRALHLLALHLHLPPPALISAVTLVVANNHHFRIAPYEARLPLHVALRYAPPAARHPCNLLGTPAAAHLAPQAAKLELSHHLAHAHAALFHAPVRNGLVVVMDGMGDRRADWVRARADDDHNYYAEDDCCPDAHGFRQFPADLSHREPFVAFREAETVYRFWKEDGRLRLERLYKRWTPENQPPELPNHSFEHMDSVGAVYSRIAAIIFRDWNACGKVMGLAPYAEKRMAGKRKPGERFFMQGDLWDGSLCMKEGKLKGLEHIDKGWADAEHSLLLREYFEDLAYHVQKDLEDVVSNFVTELQKATGEETLVFAGGVALNSTLNGVLAARNDFKQVYVPPYPGDEGIAIGCAAFGYYLANASEEKAPPITDTNQVSPYLGISYSQEDIIEAMQSFNPWITWREANVAQEAAQALAKSKVVAWFMGRSEFGPRALGNRSILADPRVPTMLDHVNKVVKKRESFRPFAPAVLAEHAHEWFEDCADDSSPFMSMTKRCTNPTKVKSVVHIDGTSRLQTVKKDAHPKYHEMIAHFQSLTGIPMVLNTSFNVAGEPIVESPQDALRSFLGNEGMDMLVFPGLVIEKSPFSLVEEDNVSSACSDFRSHEIQDSAGSSLRTTITYIPRNCDSTEEDKILETSIELIDGLQLEVLEYVHNQGPCSIPEIVQDVLEGKAPALAHEDPEFDAPTKEDILSRLISLGEKRLLFKS